MTMVTIFGYVVAAGALFTSIAMAVMGGRWQAIESQAYGEEKRPLWFKLISAGVILFYLFTLISFINSPDKNWASWFLAVVIPVGWGLKGALIVFNPKGRKAVSAISGDKAWRQVALARLPIAIILGVIAYLA